MFQPDVAEAGSNQPDTNTDTIADEPSKPVTAETDEPADKTEDYANEEEKNDEVKTRVPHERSASDEMMLKMMMGPMLCSICNCKFNSESIANQHYESRYHLANVKNFLGEPEDECNDLGEMVTIQAVYKTIQVVLE